MMVAQNSLVHLFIPNPVKLDATLPCIVTSLTFLETRQTAGVEIFRSLEVSPLGLVLTATVVLVMVAVWIISRMVDRRAKLAQKLEVKVVDWYIATGEVKHARDIIERTIHSRSMRRHMCTTLSSPDINYQLQLEVAIRWQPDVFPSLRGLETGRL